jgi:hypothetical protein
MTEYRDVGSPAVGVEILNERVAGSPLVRVLPVRDEIESLGDHSPFLRWVTRCSFVSAA